MTQQLVPTLRSLLAALLPVFEKMEVESVRFLGSLHVLRGMSDIRRTEELGESLLDDGSHRNLFNSLATCLNEARIQMSEHLSEAFSILADASREGESMPTHRLWLLAEALQ